MKKQYDGYLQYWPPSKNEIVNACCGSTFIGHCSSKDLAMHYREFESSVGFKFRSSFTPRDGLAQCE